jgi:hypothetical protein
LGCCAAGVQDAECHAETTETTRRDSDDERLSQDTDPHYDRGNRVEVKTSQLMVIERDLCSVLSADTNPTSPSTLPSKANSWRKSRTNSISMIQAAERRHAAVLPASSINKSKLAAFRESLNLAGIDTSRWGFGGSKSVEHLYWEVFHQRGCLITGTRAFGKLKRVTRIVKIRLVADIFGVEHALYSRLQFLHDGQCVERRQVPLRRLRWISKQGEYTGEMDESFYAEECPYTESWKIGVRKALEERLGLPEKWQQEHLQYDEQEDSFDVEDNVEGGTYPGLPTMFCIHSTTMRIVDPESPAVQLIGLPMGQEFATTEGNFKFRGEQEEDDIRIGSQLNIWTWKRVGHFDKVRSDASKPGKENDVLVPQTVVIKRVPLPSLSAQLLANIDLSPEMAVAAKRPPNPILWSAMEGRGTDWAKVNRMAKSLSDPKYSLKQFYSDLSAFPELNLYLLDGKSNSGTVMSWMGSTGRTIGDEYQRTVGAFFAIYWLMRLDVNGDGRDGFSFGVDDDWEPIKVNGKTDPRVPNAAKRMTFHKDGKWALFQKLMVDAGLLEEKRKSFGRGTYMQINQKRTVSLLALTAVHDIMKMDPLRPVVQAEHAPYHGYMVGDTIGDHDHALSYIMDYYPDMLPSFKGLDREERRSVQFTQCNLCFNHGWLVQAEAPPGAVFTSFREALIRDHKMMIGQRDIALYFVHWLTDLAGAEPTPLAGCEKFSHKFPLPVLNSFLRSFEFVEKIANETETAVLEQYLKIRWLEATPNLGPAPEGPEAIAKMRLLCMAQVGAEPILRGFGELEEDDKEVLCVEMSRTACMCQSYSQDLAPSCVNEPPEGPAFLIYYGPAFLQSVGHDNPVLRLRVLAEIYRCARELWPPAVSSAAKTVIIRIDMIKGLNNRSLVLANKAGDVWTLVKHNETEAFIERASQKTLNRMIADQENLQILDLSFMMGVEEYNL